MPACQNINRIAGDPRGKINRLVISGVKTDQDPTRLCADIFDRGPKSLWNISNITGVQLFGAKSTVRPEHCYVQVSGDDVLPFIGVWMPMKLAQRTWFEIENYSSNSSRNWKSRGIDAPFAPAFENCVRRTRKHSKLVRLEWRDAWPLKIFRYRFRRNGAAGKIDFLLWKAIKRRFRLAEIFRQQRFGRMPSPIGDTECGELREITVIKDQNEMSRLVAETLEHMAVAAWKGPDVAGFKVVRLRLTSRVDDRSTNAPFQNQRPLGGSSMPVKLAHHAGFELH